MIATIIATLLNGTHSVCLLCQKLSCDDTTCGYLYECVRERDSVIILNKINSLAYEVIVCLHPKLPSSLSSETSNRFQHVPQLISSDLGKNYKFEN